MIFFGQKIAGYKEDFFFLVKELDEGLVCVGCP